MKINPKSTFYISIFVMLFWTPTLAVETDVGNSAAARLVLLGTAGGPVARATRSQPASILEVNGDAYLIDAGDGAAAQAVRAGYKPTDIRAVFLTHHHMDHTGGLGAVIAFNWSVVRQTPLHIYGPPGTESLVQRGVSYFSISEEVFKRQSPSVRTLAEISSANDIHAGGKVYEDENIRVFAAENSHFQNACHNESCPDLKSFSYRFEIKVDDMHFLVVFSGDTGPSESLVELARDADVLVSEIIDLPSTVVFLRDHLLLPEPTLTPMVAHMAMEHLTPEEVGKLARDSGAKKVVLNHFVWGNQDREPNVETLTSTVSNIYRGPVVPGHDMQVIELNGLEKEE